MSAGKLQVTSWREISGTQKWLNNLQSQIGNAPKLNIPVAILGENGVGKTLLARAIHKESSRSDKPLVRFNCSSPPLDMIDAELFGHAMGAYTGADIARKGVFRQANGGILFLEELGNMPRYTQEKLLTVLDDGKAQGLGEEEPYSVDVRIISATNTALEDAVKAGAFREDLYYRLIRWKIHVPPLQQDPEQVLALVTILQLNLMKDLGVKNGKALVFEKKAKDALMEYTWPGNVRELRNVLERLIVKYSKVGNGEDRRLVTVEDIKWAIKQPPPPPPETHGDDAHGGTVAPSGAPQPAGESAFRERQAPRSENSLGETVAWTAEVETQQMMEGMREKKRRATVEEEYFDEIAEAIRGGKMTWKAVVPKLAHGVVARLKGTNSQVGRILGVSSSTITRWRNLRAGCFAASAVTEKPQRRDAGAGSSGPRGTKARDSGPGA